MNVAPSFWQYATLWVFAANVALAAMLSWRHFALSQAMRDLRQRAVGVAQLRDSNQAMATSLRAKWESTMFDASGATLTDAQPKSFAHLLAGKEPVRRITALHVWLYEDPAIGDMLPVLVTRSADSIEAMPLIGFTPDMAERLRSDAQKLARQSGGTVRLVQFTATNEQSS